MKKVVIAGVLGLGIPAASFAQSSVTLYGIIDEGLTFTTNQAGHRNYQLSAIGLQASRWGLRGTEDLGNGLSAIFVLENGFDPTNGTLGQGGRMFGRQAYVGLSNRYGTVTAGRQYGPVVDSFQILTINGGLAGPLFAHPLDNDDTDNTYHSNNSIKYRLPNIGGLTGSFQYAFSNAAGDFANNRMWGSGLNYANGPFMVAATYESFDNPGVHSGGTANANGAVVDGSIASSRQTIAGLGGSYTFGPAKVGFTWTRTQFFNVGATGNSGISYRFNNYETNLTYRFTPAAVGALMYTYTTANIADPTSGDRQSKIHQVGGLFDYNLSKRTDVYTALVYQHAAGGALFANASGGPVADIYLLTASTTRNQGIVRIGMRHKF
jgi:GBP family porin